MADDTSEKACCQKSSENDDNDDRPPPIPPRPSFTFRQRDKSTAIQSDSTDGCKLTADDVDCGKPPVPPPRSRSKKSTEESSAVVAGHDAVVTANDEVFLVSGDLDTEVEACDDEDLDTEVEACDDVQYSCSADPSCEPDSCTSDEQLTVPARTGSSHHQETGSSSMSAAAVIAADNAERCEQQLSCQLSSADDVSTGPVTGPLVSDDRNKSQLQQQHLPGSVEETSDDDGDDDDDDDDDDATEAALSTITRPSLSASSSRRVPVASCSEFDDFGLDPDLFRPDCLEDDVDLTEKTAKFTRSTSPLYEPVLDEDETG